MQILYFDTETHLFGQGNMAPKIVCVSWACGGLHELIVDDDKIEEWLRWALEGAIAGKWILAAHNAAYDAACIMSTFPSLRDLVWDAYEAGAVHCTQIREALLDISEGHLKWLSNSGKPVKKEYSLAFLVEHYFSKILDKAEDGWRMRYKELDGVPLEDWPERAVTYAIDDSIDGLRLYNHQEYRAGVLQYDMPSQAAEARAAMALQLTSVHGIRTDAKMIKLISDKAHEALIETSRILVTEGILKPKRKKDIPMLEAFMAGGDLIDELQLAKDTKVVTKLVLNAWDPGLHGDIPLTEKTKKIQLTQGVLEKCEGEKRILPAPLFEEGEGDIFDVLGKFDLWRKQANTYISKLLPGIDYPIHSRFHVLGAETSRTSSSKPNLQNQPRVPGVRECYVARDGTVFLFCDYDSQETRMLAQACLDICGFSLMAERYQADVNYDPHTEFAAKLMGISVEEALHLKKIKDKGLKKKRQEAKICNFGYPGGLGALTFVDYAAGFGLKLTEEEAIHLKEQWHEQWPEMKSYFAHVSKIVGQAGIGYQVNARSGFKRGLLGYTQVANGFFQTPAAHASKRAHYSIVKACYDPRERSYLWGCRPVNFVHDESIIEAPKAYAHEATLDMQRRMIAAMEVYTPDIPCAASASMATHWYKEAEPVFENDRLVCWEPS